MIDYEDISRALELQGILGNCRIAAPHPEGVLEFADYYCAMSMAVSGFTPDELEMLIDNWGSGRPVIVLDDWDMNPDTAFFWDRYSYTDVGTVKCGYFDLGT